MEDSKPAAKPKPALKHEGATTSKASSSEQQQQQQQPQPPQRNTHKHLKWDEAIIEEHDLLRGTRMKIDEPNTPYTHYDSGAESDDSRRPKSPAHQKDSISWDTLQTKLDSVAAVREENDGAGGADDGCRDEMRKLEFKEHRKRHYNEMELVKKFRQEHPEGALAADEEEDDDADDEKE